jgi:hypothetical protein
VTNASSRSGLLCQWFRHATWRSGRPPVAAVVSFRTAPVKKRILCSGYDWSRRAGTSQCKHSEVSEGRKMLAHGASHGNKVGSISPSPVGAIESGRCVPSAAPLGLNVNAHDCNPWLTPWATNVRPYGARIRRPFRSRRPSFFRAVRLWRMKKRISCPGVPLAARQPVPVLASRRTSQSQPGYAPAIPHRVPTSATHPARRPASR